jgi:fructose transport system permease protein
MSDNYEAAVRDRSAESVAEFREPRTLGRRFQNALHTTPALVPLIVLLVSVVLFASLVGTRFFSAGTLTLILQQVQLVGIVAAAQSLVIMTAGIDLSVGAIAVLSSVIMGQFAFRYGLPPSLAVLCGLGVGTALGYVNGWLVAVMKLPPFIVTLGTWQVILATNFLYSRNETIRAQDITAEAPILQFFAQTFKIGADVDGRGGATFTYGVILMLLLIAVLAYALRSTAWGGTSTPWATTRSGAASGVNVRGTLISVYALSGLICAFAGWALIGRIGSVSPDLGGRAQHPEHHRRGDRGHLALRRARVHRRGAVRRADRRGVLARACASSAWTRNGPFFFIGVLIIVAVAVDQWIRKVAA